MLVWCIILTSCFALLVQYLGTVFNSYWIIYHLLVYYNLLYGYSNIDGKQLYMGKSVNDCATWWVNCFRQEIPSQSCISWVSNSWRSTEMFHFCINLKPMKAFVSTWNQWKPLYQSGTNENLCIIHYDFQNVGALLTQKVSKDIMVCTKWNVCPFCIKWRSLIYEKSI